MRVLLRTDSTYGSVYQALSLSTQTFSCPEDFMRLMQKKRTSVSDLYIESDAHRVLVHNSELSVVARLASAFQNYTVAEHYKYQKDLYGLEYTPPLERHAPQKIHAKHAPAKCTPQTVWDEETNGDRFVFDSEYEQNEDFVPWRMRDAEERFGLYE